MEKKMSLKVSVSSMDTYKKCPKKYHYTYIIKPKIEKKKWIHTEFGSCAHRMLELFHKKYIDSPFTIKEAAAIMKECYTEALKEFDLDILEGYTWSPEGDISGIPYLRKIMQFYLNEIKANGIPNVIGVEVPYSFMVGKTEVRGFIDRIDLVEPGHYNVVDYKTSKSESYMTNKQLKIYAEAITRMYPDAKKVSGEYIMLKLYCKRLSWDFSAKDLQDLVKDIEKTSDMIINEEKWNKKPSALCSYCDYKGICQDVWLEGEDANELQPQNLSNEIVWMEE
jgi:ATP-dependent helicase/DNAse subunit B